MRVQMRPIINFERPSKMSAKDLRIMKRERERVRMRERKREKHREKHRMR